MLVYLLSLIETDSDKAIFTSMFQEYGRKGYAVCMTILHNQHDAEDAMTAAWVKVIEHLETAKRYFSGSKSIFEGWLVTIMKNVAKDEQKKKDRAPEPMEIWPAPSVNPERDNPESEYQLLKVMIRTMPPKTCALLEMRLVGEYSFKEIGKALKCSEDAARMRYNKAVADLKKRMGRE